MGGCVKVFGVMRRAVLLLVVMVLCACGSRKRLLKEELRKDIRLEVERESRIEAKLQALELLDIDFRQVERKDSSGRVETKTHIVVKRNRESVEQERQEREEKQRGQDQSESEREEEERRRSSFVVWGVVAVCVLFVSVVGGLVYLRRKKRREYL